MPGLLDYGYGPVTPRTRAGLLNDVLSEVRPGEAQKASSWWYDLVKPHTGERTARNVEGAARALVDTSPIPAAVAAYEDPSLGSVTNAGVHGLMSIGRPLQALKLLGAAYGGAGAKDLGLLDALTPFPAEAEEAKKRTKPVAKLPGLTDEDNAAYLGIMTRLSAGDFSSGPERRALEAQAKIFTDKAGLAGQRATELEAAKKAADQAEYDRSVARAETARDAELARDRRFSDTETGKLWDKTGGLAPGLLAFGTGALARMASGRGGGYALPLAVGAGEGAVATNIPLGYNAFFTEPDNPQRRAYEAYARELPPTHPRRSEWAAYAQSLPEANPIRKAASDELYNPIKAIERLGYGALEGGVGALTGKATAATPGRLVEGAGAIGPRYEQAYYEALADAQKARQALPGGPRNTQNVPGNAQPPGGGLLPPAVSVSPPNPQPQPVPGAQGSQRAVRYGKAQQDVARALVDSEVGIGGSVPSTNALENAYRSAGVKVPTVKKYGDLVNDTQQLVSEMQAKGMAPGEIVKALKALRANGAPILGLGAAGAMAAPGLLDFGDSP